MLGWESEAFFFCAAVFRIRIYWVRSPNLDPNPGILPSLNPNSGILLNPNPDPDPDCFWVQIKSGSGFRASFFMTIEIFLIKTVIYVFLNLYKGRSVSRRSLQPYKVIFTLEIYSFFPYFRGEFWPAWIRIPNPDPDLMTILNPGTSKAIWP